VPARGKVNPRPLDAGYRVQGRQLSITGVAAAVKIDVHAVTRPASDVIEEAAHKLMGATAVLRGRRCLPLGSETIAATTPGSVAEHAARPETSATASAAAREADQTPSADSWNDLYFTNCKAWPWPAGPVAYYSWPTQFVNGRQV